jgi:hypothetical protein
MGFENQQAESGIEESLMRKAKGNVKVEKIPDPKSNISYKPRQRLRAEQ